MSNKLALKMKTMCMYLCVAVLSCGIGCRTSESSRQEPLKAYAVQAVFIEGPETMLQATIDAWTLVSSPRAGWKPVSEDVMNKLRSTPHTRIADFPILYVDAGERAMVNEQKLVRFASAYDTNGTPTEYSTQGVGRLIDVDLKSVTNGMARFSYRIEDVGKPTWMTYGRLWRKMKQPFFPVRSVVSSSCITVYLDTWLITGGLISELKDGTRLNMIVGIQMRETRKAQPERDNVPAAHWSKKR
jgi:hypothetical protein